MGTVREVASPKELVDLARQRLVPLVFSGWYSDRVWVEAWATFRDRIQVDNVESDAIHAARSVLRKAKNSTVDVSIAKNDSSVCLFVDWGQETKYAFGHYWFLLQNVNIVNQGLVFDIKVVRSVVPSDDLRLSKCPHCGLLPIDKASDGPNGALSVSGVANALQPVFRDLVDPVKWAEGAKTHLNPASILNALRFIFILIMAVISGAAQLLPEVLRILNRTVHECAFFLRQATPFLLACVHVVNNTIGAAFAFAVMMWKDLRKPAEETRPRLDTRTTRALQGPSYSYSRSDSYKNK